MNIDQLIINFIWRGRRSRTANTIFKEKNRIGGLVLPDFKTYYRGF